MYGAHRFLYENMMTAPEMITVSSQAPGIVSGASKTGTGSAQIQSFGQYTGTKDMTVLVQIHDVSAGKEIGQAKYRWRTSETPLGSWEEMDVVTHNTPRILKDGIKIQFVSGSGDDFETLDTWQFRALATWGAARLLNLNRGTVFKTEEGVTSLTITIDLDVETLIRACVIFDHNFSDSASILLQGNSVDVWMSPAYSQVVSVSGEKPVTQYFNEICRYWRFVISDSENTDGFLEIGNLYLGNYLELQAETADWGSSEELVYYQAESKNEAGIVQEAVYSEQWSTNLSFDGISNSDVEILRGMFQALRNPGSGKSSPLFFHRFSDESGDVYLARILSSLSRTFSAYELNNVGLQLEEIVNSRQRG